MTPFAARVAPLGAPHGGGVRIELLGEDDTPLTWRAVLTGWQRPAFAAAFARLLARQEPAAFFWETPPLTEAGLDAAFACAVVPAPALVGLAPDPTPFAAELATTSAPVSAFDNLGGDALLVVPRCADDTRAHGAHLAVFVRGAPEAACTALWAAVAAAVEVRVGYRPLWLSTAGGGVAWLHVRLDRTPKYYQYPPWRAAPAPR